MPWLDLRLNVIKDGILTVNNIYGTPFRVDLIPETNKKARPGRITAKKGFTIHNTGNSNPKADAKMHTAYVDSEHGYSSWHFTVDDKIIFQELPTVEQAYHAGDGRNGIGNMTQIAIEICETGNWKKARENGIKLIVFLIELLFPDMSAVKIVNTHQKWTGKYCPRIILSEGWTDFLQDIDKYRQKREKKMLNEDQKIELKKAFESKIITSKEYWGKRIEQNTPINSHEVLALLNNLYESITKK
jgi:N-acetylmuramoyl-L-alanine amidase CwlA